MSGGGGSGRKAAGPSGEEAEVEALLWAAQDAVLLKLQANSHLISTSASASVPAPAGPLDGAAAAADPLEDDLARRFNALKSRAAAPAPKSGGAGAAAAAAGGGGGMDELEARFAALKGVAAGVGSEKEARVKLEDLGGESSDEESEVDKVMRWAMDAARLDVATAGALAGDKGKPAEAEEDERSSVSSEDDDDEEEEERMKLEMARKGKEMAKSKTKSKWFFL
ncbi:unnamed protein product [Urochloa humidicola]